MDAWRASTIPDLVRAANAVPPPDFAQLLPRVLPAADAGDEVARGVLEHAGMELAALAHTAIRRLWPEDKEARVALAGGVFAHSAVVRLAFVHALRRVCPGARVSFKIVEPALGALAMARKLTAQSATAEVEKARAQL
jgi:N-acetylglucosamine kinase-like BadF-type ATPase